MAGYPKNRDSVDTVVGELAVSVNRAFRRAVQFKTELDSFSDTALTNAGFNANEVTALRTFAADLVQLNSIYNGSAALASAKDFRASLRPMWGVLGDY